VNYSGSEVLPTKNKMTYHSCTKCSYHRRTTCSANWSCIRGDIVHVTDVGTTRTGARPSRMSHSFPNEKRSAANSIVRLVSCWRECRSGPLHRICIWRPVCLRVGGASVPDITSTTVRFARCGIRCTTPHRGALRSVRCDMRRRRRRNVTTCDAPHRATLNTATAYLRLARAATRTSWPASLPTGRRRRTGRACRRRRARRAAAHHRSRSSSPLAGHR
jgi:hypothetical protein